MYHNMKIGDSSKKENENRLSNVLDKFLMLGTYAFSGS